MAIGDKVSWDALRRIGASNPIIKWGVVVIVALYAVEFLGERALDLWVKFNNAPAIVTEQNAKARSAKAEADAKSSKPGRWILGTGDDKDDFGKPLPKLKQESE